MIEDTSRDWQSHEDHVAVLYRLLGYNVQPNINKDGQQVDLICEKWIEGIGRTVLCVDCKYTVLDVNRSVSKDDIDQFIYSFKSRADANGWTAGVLVSNRSFTQFAHAAALRHPNIHLKTIADLHDEILRIRAYLHESIRRYDAIHRFYDYIPHYGSLSESPHPTADSPRLLMSIILEWLKDNDHPQLCLFGDFGTGKTTFLEYLHYNLAKRYLFDSTSRIPLFISLRKYYDATDTEELIQRFFSLECTAMIQYPLFQDFLRSGRFLLLLDGFDEMGARSDPTTRKTNYLKLAPLIEGNAKVLLSCRPAYFLSIEETQSVFSFISRQVGFAPPVRDAEVAAHLYHAVEGISLKPAFSQVKAVLSSSVFGHLSLFDLKQIRAYIRKHDDSIRKDSDGQLNHKSLLQRIHDIYDLEDLAQRPILLKLIVSTLPLFRKAPDGSYNVTIAGVTKSVPDITPSVLYSVYTEKELEREYLKGQIRWLIDRAQKVEIIAALAFEMFKNDTLAADRHVLAGIIRHHFPSNEVDQAFYITDIRTCSFLSRDHQDSVRFTHKSFMEYFTAVHMRTAIRDSPRAQDILSMRALSDEVAYFLGDGIASSADPNTLAHILQDTFQRLQRLATPSQICMENILNTLNYARRPLKAIKNLKATTLIYRKLVIREVSLEQLSCETLKTVKSDYTTLRFRTCDIKKWECEGTRIRDMELLETHVRGVRFWDSRTDRMIVSGGSLSIETMRRTTVKQVSWKDAVIAGSSETLGISWVPEEGIVERCILINLSLSESFLQRIQLRDCTFVFCRAEFGATDWAAALQGSRGVLISDCATEEQDEKGVASWSQKELSRAVTKPPVVPTWNQLLALSFAANWSAEGGLRFPKSAGEIRARLRQVNAASVLMRRRGATLFVEGSGSDQDGECRLVDCTPQEGVFLNLKKNKRFMEPLRRVTVDQSTADFRLVVSAGG
jgi:hypothetical protein